MVEDRKTKVLRVKNTTFKVIERYAKSKSLTTSEAISEIIEDKGTQIQDKAKVLGADSAEGFLDFRKEFFGLSVQFEKVQEDLNGIKEKLGAWIGHGGVVLEYDNETDSSADFLGVANKNNKNKSERIHILEGRVREIEDIIEEQIEKEQTIELQFDDGVKKVLLNSKDFEIEIKEPGFLSTCRVATLLYKQTDEVFEVDEAEDPVKFEKIVKYLNKG